MSTQKRRVFKNKAKVSALIIALLLLLFVIYAGYYGLNIYLTKAFTDTIHEFSTYFSLVSIVPQNLLVALISQREYFANPKSMFMAGSSANVSLAYLDKVGDSARNLQTAFQYVSEIFESDDANKARKILYGNLCDLYKIPENINLTCQLYGNGILTKGGTTALVYYESLLRENLEMFLLHDKITPRNVFDDSTFHIPNILLQNLLLPVSRDITNLFSKAAGKLTDDSQKNSILVCTGFGVIILCCVGLVASLFIKTASKLKKLRVSLTLLPIQLLKKIRRFKKYVHANVSSESLLLSTMADNDD